MADAAIVTAGILRVLVAAGLTMVCCRLGMMRVVIVLLDSCMMTTAAHRLHGGRHSQRVAAKYRQPDGYKHRNKFSD
jgi:hypothetical protein